MFAVKAVAPPTNGLGPIGHDHAGSGRHRAQADLQLRSGHQDPGLDEPALVNPRGDAEVNGLLPSVRASDDPGLGPGPGNASGPPTEPIRRAAVLARLQVTERANPRLRVLAGEPAADGRPSWRAAA